MSPTPLDKMLTSKNAFLAFSGIILAVSAYSILKRDVDAEEVLRDPPGEPEEWTVGEMKVWLRKRELKSTGTREKLLKRVRKSMRPRK